MALEQVKKIASNGEKTQLVLHYSGHGEWNGGYIAEFADSKESFSEATRDLSRECENVWAVTVWDACAIQEGLGARGNSNSTAEAPVATFKTVTLSACRLG